MTILGYRIMHFYDEFQSTPAPKGGCDPSVENPANKSQGFNPHPPRRAGVTFVDGDGDVWVYREVSIHTRPEGRV